MARRSRPSRGAQCGRRSSQVEPRIDRVRGVAMDRQCGLLGSSAIGSAGGQSWPAPMPTWRTLWEACLAPRSRGTGIATPACARRRVSGDHTPACDQPLGRVARAVGPTGLSPAHSPALRATCPSEVFGDLSRIGERIRRIQSRDPRRGTPERLRSNSVGATNQSSRSLRGRGSGRLQDARYRRRWPRTLPQCLADQLIERGVRSDRGQGSGNSGTCNRRLPPEADECVLGLRAANATSSWVGGSSRMPA